MMIYTFGAGETAFNDGETDIGWNPQSFAYGGLITFPQAGTVDQLGFYGRWSSAQGGQSVKIALYDASGNLVASATISSLPVSGTRAWHDSTAFTPVAVSAGDYFIMFVASSQWAFYGQDTANEGYFAETAYADFPADPETIVEEPAGPAFGGRANFTAGGSASVVPVIMHHRRMLGMS